MPATESMCAPDAFAAAALSVCRSWLETSAAVIGLERIDVSSLLTWVSERPALVSVGSKALSRVTRADRARYTTTSVTATWTKTPRRPSIPRMDSRRWNAPPIEPPMAPSTTATMRATNTLRTALRWTTFAISAVYWLWNRKTNSRVPKKKISAMSGWITPRWYPRMRAKTSATRMTMSMITSGPPYAALGRVGVN